jgi:hypothetical protein
MSKPAGKAAAAAAAGAGSGDPWVGPILPHMLKAGWEWALRTFEQNGAPKVLTAPTRSGVCRPTKRTDVER